MRGTVLGGGGNGIEGHGIDEHGIWGHGIEGARYLDTVLGGARYWGERYLVWTRYLGWARYWGTVLGVRYWGGDGIGGA